MSELDNNGKPRYYKFDGMEGQVPHGFMSEELLVPRACSCDAQRLNMWSNHISQIVHLNEPEVPRVFTNFENQVGEHSIAYKRLSEDSVLVEKIYKNPLNYVAIFRNSEGAYDLVKVDAAVNITESYGYAIQDDLKNVKNGDMLPKGSSVFSSSLYDEEGNFRYGRNLEACFLPWKGFTMEDAIVISESAAKKMSSQKVELVTFILNHNCLLLNLYGDENNYKCFPLVGEDIKDSVLCAKRQIQYDRSLFDLKDSQLREIGLNDDVYHYPNGKVVDISIYSNTAPDVLAKNGYSKEISDLYNSELKFYTTLGERLKRIVTSGAKYSENIGYWIKRCSEYRDENKVWKFTASKFEGVLLQFTILKTNTLQISSKLTGRYGNKGVISKIIPDSEMPRTKDGYSPDVLLNPLGVINRINIAQLHEQHINWMSNNLLRHIKKLPLDEQWKEITWYIRKLNPIQCDFIIEHIKTKADKTNYISDAFNTGIAIHQPPFYGCATMDVLRDIYREKPYLCEKYKFEGVANPLVSGAIYFVRLKHESSNKFSARSTSATNIKQSPAKASGKKKNTDSYAHTPVRMGEMETSNLLICKNGDIVSKMLRTYSSSENDRMALVEDILTAKDPLQIKVRLVDDTSANRKILDAYLYILGIKLTNSSTSDYLASIFDNIDDFDPSKPTSDTDISDEDLFNFDLGEDLDMDFGSSDDSDNDSDKD